ncbi:MAG: GNAT family N-acetyltransferase [Cyanobacteria bacterium J06621_8]
MQFCQIEFGSELYQQECRIRNEILRQPLGMNLYAENLDLEANYYHFGIIKQETLISCAIGVPLNNQTIKFRQILVISPWQRQGIGSMIMNRAEEFLQQLNFSQFELNARKSAIDFYRKIGYQTVGVEFLEINLPHIKMVKHT